MRPEFRSKAVRIGKTKDRKNTRHFSVGTPAAQDQKTPWEQSRGLRRGRRPPQGSWLPPGQRRSPAAAARRLAALADAGQAPPGGLRPGPEKGGFRRLSVLSKAKTT